MPKFRKKPVIIEAVQFTQKMLEAYLFDGCGLPVGVVVRASYHSRNRTISNATVLIPTLEGEMEVSIDDWVITGVRGEHYPCKPDIFEMTYELVKETDAPGQTD